MSLYNYLTDSFGFNEPIMTEEISFNGYSKPWLYKELNKLCESGKLVRYEKGVYYIPTETALGKSVLNPRKVIEKKYVSGVNGAIGYYSGITFLNKLGLTTQMPNAIEIYTNKEMSQVRDVFVGKQKVTIRKARTEINEENVAILGFLELMNFVTASFFDEEKKNKICQYIKEQGITRKVVTKYAPLFPDKAMRTLVESEVIYDIAQ